MYYESNELYHHGVKGMKWGVRKDKRQARIEKKRKRIQKRTEGLVKSVTRGNTSYSGGIIDFADAFASGSKNKNVKSMQNAYKKGAKKSESVIRKYGDLRIEALEDKSIKKTAEYKTAKKEYNKVINDPTYYYRQATREEALNRLRNR